MVSLTLKKKKGCTIADDQGIGTILNDDGTRVWITDVWLMEGAFGTKEFIFTATRSGDISGASSVDYMSADGTAVSPSDFAAVPLTTLAFGSGDSTKAITV